MELLLSASTKHSAMVGSGEVAEDPVDLELGAQSSLVNGGEVVHAFANFIIS